MHATRAKVTIPEGWNRFDIAKRLQSLHVAWAAGFLDATANTDLLREIGIEGENAEGFLFPATYDLPLDSDPKDVVRRLVWRVRSTVRAARAKPPTRPCISSKERSAGAARDRDARLDGREGGRGGRRAPIIASVFLNRLRDPAFKRKVLQCDPTSVTAALLCMTGAGLCRICGEAHARDQRGPAQRLLDVRARGASSGPIGNPGMKSLQAVLAPSSTKYLYFVVRGDHRHAFSETLEDHDTAVKDLKGRPARDH